MIGLRACPLLCLLTLAVARSPSAELQNVSATPLEDGAQHWVAFTNDSVDLSAPSRQLQGGIFNFLPPLDINGLVSQVGGWIQTASAQIASALGMNQIVDVLRGSLGWLDKGFSVLGTCWNAFTAFAQRMVQLFNTYRPLKPVFESSNGIMQLLTNRMHIHNLAAFVQGLLDTSGVLRAISSAAAQVSQVYYQLTGLFHSAMVKAMGFGRRRLMEERRLFGYLDLLSGLNFPQLVNAFRSFVGQAGNWAGILDQINAVIGPLVRQVGQLTARRLQEDFVANSQRYGAALRQLVPAWQGVERLGMKMCPEVANSFGQTQSLGCRVQRFVGMGGVLGYLGNLLGMCPTAPRGNPNCPRRALSDSARGLSQYAGMLGWVLAALVACGLLGGGASMLGGRQSGMGQPGFGGPQQGFGGGQPGFGGQGGYQMPQF